MSRVRTLVCDRCNWRHEVPAESVDPAALAWLTLNFVDAAPGGLRFCSWACLRAYAASMDALKAATA